jgi:hypothetical protein
MMTSLKQEYLAKVPDERMLADLKKEISFLREQGKFAK